MSPELDLLDQLLGGDMPYTMMEQFVFEGDRLRALRSIELMRTEGLIAVSHDGREVEHWQLLAWRRAPDDPETTSTLDQVKISITDIGARWIDGSR